MAHLLLLPGSRRQLMIMEPLVEQLQHINTLLDETRGAFWLTKIDLAHGCHQVLLSEAYW